MDRARRCTTSVLHQLVRRSTVGFRSKSFRFEGGGRLLIGLKRTGKSCRLRWVNYLHPDLKSGKMSPQEERLVLDLHSKWGNRWSRIARKLPGRTDNEIKNYWRTHMRKKAQEKRKAMSSSLLQSSSPSSSNSSSTTNYSSKGFEVKTTLTSETEYAAGSTVLPTLTKGGAIKKSTLEEHEDSRNKVYSMDEIWKDFELSPPTFRDDDVGYGGYGGVSYFSGEIMDSPVWDDSLWAANEKESMMFPPTIISDQLYSSYHQDTFEYI